MVPGVWRGLQWGRGRGCLLEGFLVSAAPTAVWGARGKEAGTATSSSRWRTAGPHVHWREHTCFPEGIIIHRQEVFSSAKDILDAPGRRGQRSWASSSWFSRERACPLCLLVSHTAAPPGPASRDRQTRVCRGLGSVVQRLGFLGSAANTP